MLKVMDHTKYVKALKTKTVQELRFIIKDCAECLACNPDNPNNGFYLDEVSYASMELKRRG
jgi:hypothetical protein